MAATAVSSYNTNNLPRAASFPSLLELDFKDAIFEEETILQFNADDFRDDVSEAETVASDALSIRSSPEMGCLDYTGDSDATSDEAEPDLSRSSTVRSSRKFFDLKRRSASPESTVPRTSNEKTRPSSRSISRTISNRLKRQSWLPGSRSPSPKPEERLQIREESPAASPSRLSRMTRRTSMLRNKNEAPKAEKVAPPKEVEEEERRSRSTSLSRRSSTLGKRLGRPLSFVGPTSSPSRNPSPAIPRSTPEEAKPTKSIASAFHLPKSFSADKLATTSRPASIPQAENVRVMTKINAIEKSRKEDAPKPKKDELWSSFRTLESDLDKFNSRPSSSKANVIRGCLLPFLRTYQSHPSMNELRPEDLERRAKILDMWWTALLDILHNDGSQAMSPADRPTVMDAISRIMEREEWRKQSNPLSPPESRSSSSMMSRTDSTHSLSSNGSDFVSASVSHNVRTIFERNLLSQMVFVVDKMSSPRTPASIVDFCGKTCAYAFFFCPGIADILVRLWSPTVGLLQRVLNAYGFSRGTDLAAVSRRVVPAFPAPLQSLEFHSLVKLYKALKISVPPPLGTAQINWTGDWTKRWSGKESDLFYEFSRQYFSLVAKYLPDQPTKEETICTPGLIFVNAQLLLNLDATMNRHAATSDANAALDDGTGDPDASVIAVPAVANANRSMTDNRIIKLVRELISGAHAPAASARYIFAAGFSQLLQASAKCIAVINNSAIFTLCDFLEEALPLLARYEEASSRAGIIEWSFWIDAWKRMTESHSTSVEIKVYALIFALWPSIAADMKLKRFICHDFLLNETFFLTRFNHTCPMVRSYFMRLICWRVARFDGKEDENDKAILKTLLERLYTIYSYYLYLREEAQGNGKTLPSTVPCPPIPGRRLIIVATDRAPPRTLSSVSVPTADGILAQRSTTLALMESNRIYPVENAAKPKAAPVKATEDKTAVADDDRRSRRFSLIRGMMSSSPTRENGSTKSASPVRNPDPQNRFTRAATFSDTPSATGSSALANPADYHRNFRFSLEVEKRPFGSTPHAMRLYLPRLPMPAQSYLFASSLAIDVANTTTGAGSPTSEASSPLGDDQLRREVRTQQPRPHQREVAKYSGRALAEWALVIGECQSFFERRKMEGVPSNDCVETPTLGVECIRKPC